MILPSEIMGLHRFIAKDGKVILDNGPQGMAELDFINFLDHGGVLRAKFKSIKTVNGVKTEIPWDIFIKEFSIQDLSVIVTGEELASHCKFSIIGEYRFWQKDFKVSGSIRNRAINIADKDLASLIQALMCEFN